MNSKINVKISPNLNDGTWEIQFNERVEQATIELFDVLGKSVSTFTIRESLSVEMDYSSLRSGIYLCKITLKGGNVIEKKMVIN